MRKIRIRRSTVDKFFEHLFKVLMAFVFAVFFVGVPIKVVTGGVWCGAVAAGVSCSVLYYIFGHIEIVRDGE